MSTKNGTLFLLLLSALAFLNQCAKSDPDSLGFSCPVGLDSLSVPAVNVDTSLSCLPCAFQCEEGTPGPTRYDYSYPCFNPKNQDELAFMRYEPAGVFGDNIELCILNICTGELRVIDDKALSFTDWSVKNWIIFKRRNQMLYKIKPNGDSLTQLTFTGSFNNHPVWSPDGSRFVWSHKVGSTNYKVISDELGIIKDTLALTVNAGRFEWVSNSRIAFDYGVAGQPTAHVGIIDIDSSTIKYDVFNLDGLAPYPGNYILNMDWIESEQNMVYATKLGVAKTNIHTKQRTVLVRGFDETRRYEWVRLSPDGTICITQRKDAKAEKCNVDFMARLYIVDLDGANEKWLKAPE